MTSTQKYWLLGAATVVALAIAYEVGAPSARLASNSADVAEWLGIFGLFGVLLAIVQLIQTDSVAKAAVAAAQKAVVRVMEFEAAVHLSTAAEIANRIVEKLFRGEYYSAYTGIQSLTDELVRIERNFLELQKEEIAVISRALELSQYARTVTLPWASNTPPQGSEVITLMIELERARDTINSTVEGLRAKRGSDAK